MKQFITGPSMPTAQICINKSRLKVYNKESTPTYYLNKGQEFQIELFNPTSGTILAKIYLNGKTISQGGLVLRPGERVFLERYLDVAKKFLFDTYEVANTAEVQRAIEENGDFKVEFFRESSPVYTYNTTVRTTTINPLILNGSAGGWGGSYTTTGNASTFNLNSGSVSSSSSMMSISNAQNASYTANVSLGDYMQSRATDAKLSESQSKTLRAKKSKSIETGRVEAGSQSNQRIETVSKSFDYFAFHIAEYKLLPVSQKVNTSEDINVKRYCHNCGAKQKPEFKFCPSCGAKA